MSAFQSAAVCEDTDVEDRALTEDTDVEDRDQALTETALLLRLGKLDLPAEDGIPLESDWHRIEMNLLIDSVHYLWKDRNDYFAGGNMFIYFSLQQVRNRDYRGPDFFVVKGTDGTRKRDSWVVWEELGRYPDVIVELASPSTVKTDLGVKKDLYERTFHTSEYFCYDPGTDRLLGWRLTGNAYAELKPNDRGWLWSDELGIWMGTWQGEFQRLSDLWLRFYSDDGQLVLTHKEAEAQRAEAATQRAEAATQRAEAATQRAETATQRAETEAQRAETEAQRAETEAQRAETEARRAETAEAELNRLRAILAEQGMEVGSGK